MCVCAPAHKHYTIKYNFVSAYACGTYQFRKSNITISLRGSFVRGYILLVESVFIESIRARVPHYSWIENFGLIFTAVLFSLWTKSIQNSCWETNRVMWSTSITTVGMTLYSTHSACLWCVCARTRSFTQRCGATVSICHSDICVWYMYRCVWLNLHLRAQHSVARK